MRARCAPVRRGAGGPAHAAVSGTLDARTAAAEVGPESRRGAARCDDNALMKVFAQRGFGIARVPTAIELRPGIAASSPPTTRRIDGTMATTLRSNTLQASRKKAPRCAARSRPRTRPGWPDPAPATPGPTPACRGRGFQPEDDGVDDDQREDAVVYKRTGKPALQPGGRWCGTGQAGWREGDSEGALGKPCPVDCAIRAYSSRSGAVPLLGYHGQANRNGALPCWRRNRLAHRQSIR